MAEKEDMNFDDLAGTHSEMNTSPFIHPPARMAKTSYINDFEEYKTMYKRSINDPNGFWAEQAKELLTWFRPFTEISRGGFQHGDIRWFADGQLNVSYNCLDRHTANKGNKIAIIYEGDEVGTGRSYTYNELLREVSRVANVMKLHGVQKGDTVAIYLPMIPELAFAMLACARIGAVHSVVFAGFSSDSLRDRIKDAKCKWVFTADEGRRGGKSIPLKKTTITAVSEASCVEKIFYYKRFGENKELDHPLDVDMFVETKKVRPYCPATTMDAEDLLFLLYTSGSTGKPKGIAHTSAGYLLFAALSHKYVFDVQDNDVYACVADCGWITGHSYVIYGPLCNGSTTVMFESTPLYPNPSRYWDLVQRHKITQFYTAPTAIRSLMKYGTEPLQGYDISSLRVLGSVGEPINPEAWRWYYKEVGNEQCAVVDTFWQTETGGHIMTTIPGCTPMKAGATAFPFFGIDVLLMDKEGREVTGNDTAGVVCVRAPWPGIARTIYNDHERYLATYMHAFPNVYFTGDAGVRDVHGYYWITGRVDDVLNVAGHRLGSAEIESSLVAHESVAEAAVIGFPHDTKGEGICCFVIVKDGVEESDELVAALKMQVRTVIGPFATPDHIILINNLPKTRSGKIMRRVLRKVAAGEADQLGDMSTLADPYVVQVIIDSVAAAMKKK